MKNIYNKLFNHQKSDSYNLRNSHLFEIESEKDGRKSFSYYQKLAEKGDANGTFQVGYCYYKGVGVEKDEQKALIYYQKSAELGNANGAFNVGYCYYKGIGIEKDEQKAFICFQKSAEMGSANGAFNTGYCYLKGIGVEYNEHKAFIYYQKSAEMGHASGTNSVGYCYEKGIGVEKDEHKAFIHYLKSAEIGDALGINNVGYCYDNGIGVEKDEHMTFIYYQKSAKMGYARGIFNVGICYQLGIGVEKDEQKAFIYYQKSAEMRHAGGMNMVGYCYYNGTGVEKDEQKAFFYYQKSAIMGNASGINNIGECYQFGEGVKKDENKAFFYYQKAAEMMNDSAICNLGICYLNGIGVKKDLKQAFELFLKSAKLGYVDGIRNVGYSYRNGIGTKKDLKEAEFWFRIEKNKFQEIKKFSYSDVDDNVKTILDDERYQLLWIPYDKFEDIKEIGRGGFATVYLAKCLIHYKSSHRHYSFAIKKIHDQDFFDELKAFCEIGYKNPSFLKCYGLSRDNSGNYILIFKYAKKGSLRNNLYDVSQLKWEDKLNLLSCITSDLEAIHSQGFEHRDLHSGNILQDESDNAYITDLGISNTKQEVYGVLPYIAPEILQEKPHTQAADIYGLGIIMTEISTGRKAFDGYNFDNELAIEICHGLRPKFRSGIPDCYIELAKRCMNSDPKKRPTIRSVNALITYWIEEIENIDDENKIKKQFLEANKIKPFIETPKHLKHVYISQHIDTQEISIRLEQYEIPDDLY